MVDTERTQVNVRMSAALLARIDRLLEKTRHDLSPVGTKWSRNDQIVRMLETAADDWEKRSMHKLTIELGRVLGQRFGRPADSPTSRVKKSGRR